MTALETQPHSSHCSLGEHGASAKPNATPRSKRLTNGLGRHFLRRSILALGVISANAGASQIPNGVISFDQNANSVHKRLTPDGKKSPPAPSNSMIMMSASQAARIAKRRYADGKVLKVSPFGQSQKVKMLLPGGKVTYVTVNSSGQVK